MRRPMFFLLLFVFLMVITSCVPEERSKPTPSYGSKETSCERDKDCVLWTEFTSCQYVCSSPEECATAQKCEIVNKYRTDKIMCAQGYPCVPPKEIRCVNKVCKGIGYPEIQQVENVLIEYKTSGGFTGSTHYFYICPNGKTAGLVRGQLTTKELTALKTRVEAQQFFSLKEEYPAKSTKSIVADGVDRSIRYQEGNKIKKVSVEAGADEPQAFSNIEREIKSIVDRLSKEAVEKTTSGELFASERGTVDAWQLKTDLSLASVVASGSSRDGEKMPATVNKFLLEKFYPPASELSSLDEKERARYIDFYNTEFKYFLEDGQVYGINPFTQYEDYKQGKIGILTVHQIPIKKWSFTQPLASFAVTKEEKYTTKRMPLVIQDKAYFDMKVQVEKKEPYDQTLFVDGKVQEGSKLYEVGLYPKIETDDPLPKEFCR